uniref:Uncharacterized protein n=1 Tax=viral metagenome TaxID=1070528 RepID=A0A6C0HBY3_9ZZZZ
MLTRSQTKNQIQLHIVEYEVNIDFDEASAAWKANKKSKGNGTYRYVCQGITKTGKKCSREPFHGCDFCKWHQNQK